MAENRADPKGLVVEGVILDKLPGGKYIIELEGGQQVRAYAAGRVRQNSIRLVVGDRVTVELSLSDISVGRITFRHRDNAPRSSGLGTGSGTGSAPGTGGSTDKDNTSEVSKSEESGS
jgi:translation initiation factor IF-1